MHLGAAAGHEAHMACELGMASLLEHFCRTSMNFLQQEHDVIDDPLFER